MQWRKVALIGVGLLGGSLGLAIRRKKLAREVWGYVRRSESIDECLQVGAVDQATLDLSDAVRGSDLVVFCTPIAQMKPLAEKMTSAINAQCLVTDVGSVKEPVVRELGPIFRAAGATFVGSHPMAGAEKTGVLSAREDLFEEAVCVVTPEPATPPEAQKKTELLWCSIGSRVFRLPPGEHDALVSRSSHLPHVIAAELVHQVLSAGHSPEQAALCANGFRDTTRIASGSPEMWRDIVLANRKNLLEALDGFSRHLEEFQYLLESGNAAAIQQFFADAKRQRDQWEGRGRSPE